MKTPCRLAVNGKRQLEIVLTLFTRQVKGKSGCSSPGYKCIKLVYKRCSFLFPRLRTRFQSRGKNLSGGEQQMLACSRGLVGNPDLLLLDEPSEGLAPVLVRELERVIRQIRDQKLSMLLVEQNHSFAQQIRCSACTSGSPA